MTRTGSSGVPAARVAQRVPEVSQASVAAGLVGADGDGVEPGVPLGQPAAGQGVHVGGMRRARGWLRWARVAADEFGARAAVWQTCRSSPARSGPSQPWRRKAHRRS